MRRSGSGQKGVSDTGLLLALVFFFALAVIGLPKYLKWRETAGLPAEVRHLRRINAAQQKYRAKISIKENYGSFKQLIETKLLPDAACAACGENVLTIDAYRFDLERNYAETRFCVRVSSPNGRTLAMNADGTIFDSADNRIACSMGEVTGSNLKEVK